MNRKNPIAVFDSGIGGLSTLLHLQELLPYEDFIYYADEKHFPYGEKTNEEILSYVNQIINYFQEVEVKLVVIACNTVSTFIDQLQVRYDIPLFDVISPTINHILKIKDIKSILLLGTEVTVKSKNYERNLSDYQFNSCVCYDFARLVETGDLNNPIIDKTLLACPKSDVVILGCTHYSFLKDKIKSYFNESVIVDSSKEVAINVWNFLHTNNLFNNQNIDGMIRLVTSGNPEKFALKVKKVLIPNFDLKMKADAL
jgi:glutamate racemase